MVEDLRDSLQAHFGFAAFRPGQLGSIENLLAGQHTLVVMPTGSGKSLIYQLVALRLPGQTLVISPLIALMKDQVDHLNRLHIPATYINSTLPSDEQSRRLQGLAKGTYRLVYVAPERLRSVPFQEALRGVTVSLLAVDEAHCISQWGHDFRPDYLHIAAVRTQLDNPLTVALTATATPEVQEDVVHRLGIPSAKRVVTGFNRPNLIFEVRYTSTLEAKLEALQQLFGDLEGGAAIVYVGTRREAEEVAEFIRRVVHVEAEYYHAGLDTEQRTYVQDSFLSGKLPVVAATNAFGMGIDRPDVRLVAHFNLPGTVEAYYQEAGRAGRDGQPAQAVLLYCPDDRALQEYFIENDAPTLEEVRSLYEALRKMGQAQMWVTYDDLSLLTSLPESKLKVGLAQLEDAGVVQRLGDAGQRMLLRLGPWDEAALQGAAARVAERRQHRTKQLEHIVSYAESNGCRRRILLDHFGDRNPAEAPDCCDNCLTRRPESVSTTQPNDISCLSQSERTALVILDAVHRLKWEVGREKLAQLLKGSRSKKMQQFGYDRNAYYGRLAVCSLAEIEALVEQLISRGYLKVIGGEWPVVKLTPQGEVALKARASIPLQLSRSVSPEAVARKRAERQAGGTVVLTGQMFAQGLTPAQIAAQRELNERTIYGHLAQLIGEGAVPLLKVVPEDIVSSIRAAIEQVGDVSALFPIKALLPDSISYEQIRCVVEAWKREQSPGKVVAKVERREADPIHAFLSQPHPRKLSGSWQVGWALDVHSSFTGAEWSRSSVGGFVYRLKYQSDPAALPPLVEHALSFCAAHPDLSDVDALIPVPPSTPRALDPVGAFAEALGAKWGRPIWASVLVKARATAPQKEMRTLAQKRANVAGAFAVRGDVRGKRLLIVDDLFDSGATLEEVSRVLRQAGAALLCVLTLTCTIHTDK